MLSYITPDDSGLGTMSDFFDDVAADDELFLHEQIAKELAQRAGMRKRSVSKGWREDRNIYEFMLPTDGWFVDITASDSIGALDEQLCTALAGRFGIEELHVSHLTADGDDARAVTTYLATEVRSLVLDDGSLPHGIVYPSKCGTDLKNYAVWLRRRDDGTDSARQPFDLVASNAINLHVEAFQSAVKRLRLTAY
ncbi:RES domain-containing protein [Rhodococcus sp. C26F]